MIAPNSRIILLKCPIELDENNQLNFSNATAQYNYFYSLSKVELDDATFQRKDGVIRFETNETTFTFDDVLLAATPVHARGLTSSHDCPKLFDL